MTEPDASADFDTDDELVSAYLDGETTAEETARVENDPALLARVEGLREVRALLAAPVTVGASDRDAAITAALAAFGGGDATDPGTSPGGDVENDVVAPVVSLSSRRRRRMQQWLSAAAVVVAVAAVVGLMSLAGNGGDSDASSDEVAAELADTATADDALESDADAAFEAQDGEARAEDSGAEEESAADLAATGEATSTGGGAGDERADEGAAEDVAGPAIGDGTEDVGDGEAPPVSPPLTPPRTIPQRDLGDAATTGELLDIVEDELDPATRPSDDDAAPPSEPIACPLPDGTSDILSGTVADDTVIVFVVGTDEGDRLAIVTDAGTCAELDRRII
ncbi:MAG: hypothetical protein S0880_04630 [Actinomycetota bacterium]|nr:hypothetical protein [Actinomycetota bacterium]